MIYLYKGSKKVDSFYLNAFPLKQYYCKKECCIREKVIFNQMFPIRLNSCIYFNSLEDAKDYIDDAINSIYLDERFNDDLKLLLIKYVSSFVVK
jgi:hypothetical protein